MYLQIYIYSIIEQLPLQSNNLVKPISLLYYIHTSVQPPHRLPSDFLFLLRMALLFLVSPHGVMPVLPTWPVANRERERERESSPQGATIITRRSPAYLGCSGYLEYTCVQKSELESFRRCRCAVLQSRVGNFPFCSSTPLSSPPVWWGKEKEEISTEY